MPYLGDVPAGTRITACLALHPDARGPAQFYIAFGSALGVPGPHDQVIVNPGTTECVEITVPSLGRTEILVSRSGANDAGVLEVNLNGQARHRIVELVEQPWVLSVS